MATSALQTWEVHLSIARCLLLRILHTRVFQTLLLQSLFVGCGSAHGFVNADSVLH